MKIECVKEKLSAAVSVAEKITGRNLTLPVLSCVLLEAKQHTLTLKATNLDLGIEISMPVRIDEEGTVAVPGHILHSFLSTLKTSKNITLETQDTALLVSTPTHSTVIKTLPAEDFPTIPHIEGEKKFTLNPQDFVKGLKSVAYSAAVSSMKPELSSIYIYPGDGVLVFVATDSFRLAEKKVRVKKLPEFSHILIPFKNIGEIVRVMGEAEEECEVAVSKNQISFTFPGTYLTSRIIDGNFPDYKQIIPKDHKTEAIILTEDLVGALRMATIFSDKFNQVAIKALPSKKTFEIRTKNSDVGENNGRLDATLQGDDVEINFNYKYIADSFQSIDSDSVSLQFNGVARPLVVRGVNDSSFLYIVMPMNK